MSLVRHYLSFCSRIHADEHLQALDKGFKPTAEMAEPDETVAATAEDMLSSLPEILF